MPARMAAVEASLIREFTRGTWAAGKFSGMDPFRAGLNMVDCVPMKKITARMPAQFPRTSIRPPNSMASSSMLLAATTMCFLTILSANQPAQAENAIKGSENSTVAMLCMEVICVLAASRMAACL